MAYLLCRTGLGMTKRKAVPDPWSLRCYSCRRNYDREIAMQEYGGYCPRCGKQMRPAVLGYKWVCVKCGEPV